MDLHMPATEDGGLISDRTRRFLHALASDSDVEEQDDNEYVFLSSGQVLDLKSIRRNSLLKQTEKFTDSATSSRHLWNSICSYNSTDYAATLINRLLCTPISYASSISPSHHACVIIALTCGLMLCYQFRSFVKKPKFNGSRSSQSNESALAVPKAGKEIQLQAQHSLTTEMDSSKRKDDPVEADSKDAPELVADDIAANEGMLLRSQPSTTLAPDNIRSERSAMASQGSDNKALAQTVISIPSPIRTTIDDARHAVALVAMYEQACAEQGRVCDHNAALQWAAQQQKAEKMLNARREEELRRYLWDNAQRTVDRSLSQNQHDETIAVAREDKDWQGKLQAGRDKCHAALICALYQSIVGTFLIVVLRPVVQVIYLWSTLSGSEILCYGSGTSLDPTVSSTTPLTWYGRYTSYAFADSLTASLLGEAATCLAYSLGRALYVFAAITLLKFSSWLLKQLVFVEPVQNAIKSAVLVLILSICGWVPGYTLCRILFCLTAIAITCYVLVQSKFRSVRTQFRRMNKLPHVSVVSLCLEWFDDVIGMIQMIPVIVFGGLFLANAVNRT